MLSTVVVILILLVSKFMNSIFKAANPRSVKNPCDVTYIPRTILIQLITTAFGSVKADSVGEKG